MHPAALIPTLAFNGNCREAMEFYAQAMGGKLFLQTFGEAPMPVDEATKKLIVHAELANDLLTLMASDMAPGMGTHIAGTNVTLSLVGYDEKRLRALWNNLSAGGTIAMPLEKQFWGDVFGMFTDRFGIHWMVNIAEKKI
jgi:PhnB protein